MVARLLSFDPLDNSCQLQETKPRHYADPFIQSDDTYCIHTRGRREFGLCHRRANVDQIYSSAGNWRGDTVPVVLHRKFFCSNQINHIKHMYCTYIHHAFSCMNPYTHTHTYVTTTHTGTKLPSQNSIQMQTGTLKKSGNEVGRGL